MQWLKSSSLLVLLLISSNSYANKFTSVECLNGKYETEIKHKGKFFGLVENRLKIKKDKCLIEVKFKGILETTWKIDVCREPIHMKVTSKGSQDVYKREKKCEKGTKSDFCYYRKDLLESIQDHGLIFADGQREDISQSHGQSYCSYLLLQRYLDDGIVFSIFETPKNIYKEQTACAVPVVEKKIEEEKEEKKESEEVDQKDPSSGASSRGMRPISEEEASEVNSETKPKF